MSNPPSWRRGLMSRISGRSVLVALLAALVVAAVLNPIFKPPFPVLLGRTLFIAMVLLLAYTVGAQWPRERLPRWLPAWLVPLLAIVLVAPLATLAAYAIGLGSELGEVFDSDPFRRGFTWISGAAITVGLLVTLAALVHESEARVREGEARVREGEARVREREAQAERDRLQFELERSRLAKQASDTRLNLLAAQIEPHFLFNTLGNVQALVEAGSPQAAVVLKHLIAYLRAATPRLHEGEPTLGQEANLVRAYLELMRMRMPDRMTCSVDIPAELLPERFPAMALLTLVENAVRHGIDPAEAGGRIDVRASRGSDGVVHLEVADSGVGMAADAAPGTGLSNLRERLAGFYEGRARLEFSAVLPQGLRAQIHIAPAP